MSQIYLKKNKNKFVMILKYFTLILNCKIDSDCWTKSRPDIHSLYCVDGKCSRLLPAGRHCTKPSDCASYYFYGPLACSDSCKAENTCEFDDGKLTLFCCKAVPEGKDCIPGRPNLINGCNSKNSCLMDSNGEFKCLNKNKNLIFVGVFLSISGNLNINLGLNLQKKSFSLNKIKIGNLELNTFYFGIFLYAVGKSFGFLSYVFGPQSLLTSLGAVGLITNSIFAPMINNEIFTWKDLSAIIFVLTGTSIILYNSGNSHRIFSLCELMKMYQRSETILWFIFIGFLIFTLFFIIKFIEVNSDWNLPGDFQFLKFQNIYFDENRAFLKYFMILFYVSLSASIASITTLFAKSFGEMIELSLNGDNQFKNTITYVFLIMIINCTILQVYWLGRALIHYDALIVIPVFHILWTVLSVLTGGIYFQDFQYYTINQFKGFVAGLGVIFCGSGFLASRILSKNVVFVKEVVVEKYLISKDD